MKTKLPTWKTTHTFFHRLAAYISYGVIASRCGKELQTAEAWGREPESIENPNGTGKKNPFDCVLRLLALAHDKDAGLAREAAEIFSDYVKYLDEKDGKTFVEKGGSVLTIVGEATKEHTDVVYEMLKSPNPDWSKVYSEFKQSEAKYAELGVILKEKVKNAPESN